MHHRAIWEAAVAVAKGEAVRQEGTAMEKAGARLLDSCWTRSARA